MGELDVAVKTIHRQHVNPHLTPEQALQVMQKVALCFLAAVAHNFGTACCKSGRAFNAVCMYVCCSACLCFALRKSEAIAIHTTAGAQDSGNAAL